jgi:transposase
MTYSVEILNLFLFHYRNKESTNEIAKALNVSRPTVERWSIKYQHLLNSKYPIILEKKEHKDNKSNLFKDSIVQYVQSNVGCSLFDIRNHINNALSVGSICIILKKNNITHKRLATRIVCDSLENIKRKRKEFVSQIDYNFDDVIFIDESSFCINDLKRYGYGTKGESIQSIVKHKHNKQTFSLISAISSNGIVANQIIKGTVNQEIYRDFLKTNAVFQNKIVIQDNARIHHAKIVKECALNDNIILKYNPPYSPEFNPIELAFNKMKIEFRKLNHQTLDNDIMQSVSTISSENCKAFYRKTAEFINQYK